MSIISSRIPQAGPDYPAVAIRTCLWLKNLPKLVPTNIVEGRTPRVHHASPGPDRWKERSRTLAGIAAAMADQWGGLSSQGREPA